MLLALAIATCSYVYYKSMTPAWLATCTGILYWDIGPGKANGCLIQDELIAPNILTATDSVVVTLIIAMDTVLADTSDYDPVFGISDGTSFVGFIVVDKSNYGMSGWFQRYILYHTSKHSNWWYWFESICS